MARSSVRRAALGVMLVLGLTVVVAALVITPASSSPSRSRKLPDLAYVAAQIAKAEKPPVFVPSGPAFDTRKLRGKLIYEIPIATVPVNAAILAGEQQAAQLVGAKVVGWPNNGHLSEWVQGMQTAIARHADLIVLLGPDPGVLGPQVAAARSQHIPVIEAHSLGVGSRAKLPAAIKGSMPAPFEVAGKLMADYAILQTKGNLDAAVVVSKDTRATQFVLNGLLGEFNTRCGSSCKVRVINVPIPQWTTGIPTEVQSALVKDKNLNFIMPIFDGMVPLALTGVRGAGAENRVKMDTFNGTPAVLSLIKSGNTVAMDVGESAPWIGWADMDLAFRILAGVGPVKEAPVFVRLWDKKNVNQAGNPPSITKGYGNAYIAGFKKQWGLGK